MIYKGSSPATFETPIMRKIESEFPTKSKENTETMNTNATDILSQNQGKYIN